MSIFHMVGCDRMLPDGAGEAQCPVEAALLDAFPDDFDAEWAACPADLAYGPAPLVAASGWASLANGEMRCPDHYDAAEAARIAAEVR